VLHCLLSAVYWVWWLYAWTSAVNWYKIQLFFRIIQWFWLISNLIQTHFDGPWHCKDALLTCSCLKINLCFGPPPPSPHEVWSWSFPHPVYIFIKFP
jgi:hypothetical protein